MKFKHMFSPIQIGPMTVKNRFVVPPMGNNFAKTDGTWSDESVAYYAERAKGQFGLITIEATVVHKGAKGGPRKPCLYDDNSIESLKKITDACHAEGAKISIQLQNAGPEGNAKNAEVVVEEEVDLDKISIGCKIRILDCEFDEELEYKIVGSTEANSLKGKISNESPVGKALLGKKVGDTVTVETQMGDLTYKVLEIQRAEEN